MTKHALIISCLFACVAGGAAVAAGPRWFHLVFWVGAGVIVVVAEVARWRRLRPWVERACAGREWRRRFPGVSKVEIREFVRMFVSAFDLPTERYLSFRPGDEIMGVYRVLYPIEGCADCLESERFARRVEERYGVSLEAIWREGITLGEVFEKAQAGNGGGR